MLTRECPHLSFIEPQRYDRVIRKLDLSLGRYRRVGKNGRDTRSRIPRKRTRFPGQIIECGVCGRGYVFGGHGQTDHLMCDGARAHHCWNGLSVDGPLATRTILSAVLNEVKLLPDFDEAFLESVNAVADRMDSENAADQRKAEREIDRLTRELNNLLAQVRELGPSRSVHDEIKRVEYERDGHEFRLAELKEAPRSTVVVPRIDELKKLARSTISQVIDDGFELNRVMRGLVPKIVVFPYRLCDGGHPVLRSRFRLHLANLPRYEFEPLPHAGTF